MADGDVMERRRELRRRKILENSESRLKKLTSFDEKQQTNDIKHIHSTLESELIHESHRNLDDVTNELQENDDFFEKNDDSVVNNTRNIESVPTVINTLTKLLSGNEVVTKKIDTKDAIETSSFLSRRQQLILKPILTWRKWISFTLAVLSILSNYFLDEMTLNKYILAPITTLETLILFTDYLIEDGNRGKHKNDMVTAMLLMFVGQKGVKFHNSYKVFARVFEDYAIFFFTYFMVHFWFETIIC